MQCLSMHDYLCSSPAITSAQRVLCIHKGIHWLQGVLAKCRDASHPAWYRTRVLKQTQRLKTMLWLKLHTICLYKCSWAGNSEINSDSLLPSVRLLWTPSATHPWGQHIPLLHGKQALPKCCTQRVAPASDKQKLFPFSFLREAPLSFSARTTGHDSLHIVCSFCYIYFPNAILSRISPLCSYQVYCMKTTLILISYLIKTNVA